MGLNALSVGAIRAICQSFPLAGITLLDYGKGGGRRQVEVNGNLVEIDVVCVRFSKKLYLGNNIAVLLLLAMLLRLVPSAWLRKKIVRHSAPLRALDESAFVASIAGGDSFSDIYGFWRLTYVALPQWLAILLGKRLVLLPQTLGPFRSRASRFVARTILANAERIYSRDAEGERVVAELLGRAGGQVRFGYDLGFLLEPASTVDPSGVVWPQRPSPSAPLVGLNVSGLLWMGGYDGHNMFHLQLGYRGLVTDLIEALISREGAAVLLIPHVYGTAAASESDNVHIQRLYNELKPRYGQRLGIVAGRYDASGIKYIIGQCDLFIGSRMHACIAAVSQHVPAVPIAYSDKFIGVMKTVGLNSWVIDLRQATAEQVLQLVREALRRRTHTRQDLATRMPQVKADALRLFHDFHHPIPR
jgi:polysaccharide pyruvyl transferase WcaK-like protein